MLAQQDDILRSSLDQQIVHLRAETIRLLRQRNGLAPIARLPDEVLAEIFVASRDLVMNIYGRRAEGPLLDRLWSVLTHTCQAWRVVALHCPRLWSVIHFGTIQKFAWSHLMLARAHSSPLSITVDMARMMEAKREQTISEVTAHMSTIYDLSLSTGWSTVPEHLHPFLESCEATELKTLRIYNCRRIKNGKWTLPWHSLFGNFTPKLRSLIIQDSEIPWQAPLFHSPSVTSLTIEMGNARRIEATPLADLVKILSSLSRLEHLEVHHYWLITQSSSPLKKARLVHLRSVTLNAPEDQLAAILGRIDMPAAVILHLTIQRHPSVPNPLFPLAQAISDHCQTREAAGSEPMAGIHLVRMDDRHSPKWRLRAWEYTVVPGAKQTPGRIWLEVEVESTKASSVFELAQAWSLMFSCTNDLWLVGGSFDSLPHSEWSALFSVFPNVRTLRVVGMVDAVVSALYQDTLLVGRLPLPSLNDVALFDSHFVEGLTLQCWLEACAEHGSRFQSVSFLRCTHDLTVEADEDFRSGVVASVDNVFWGDLSSRPVCW
jgi:hypothetical protein